MDFSYVQLLPEDFNDNSRVWIYQSSRIFSDDEVLHIKEMLRDLVANWKSHGIPVKGYANLFFDQFIILMADEMATGVSGCSIDSSVRIIGQIEQQFKVEMFNWQSLAFIVNDKVQIIPRQQLNYALENNFITPQTLFFNNVVASKKELEEKWIIPVKESWLKVKIKPVVS
jgi:hypothetical protein